jgi:glycosyltransferase involved in cell wall biosynthesis
MAGLTQRLRAKSSLRDARVTACVPHFRCQRYIRRAVLSLLAQSHRNIDIIVVNDGDPEPPWDQLADIRDRRLIRFCLTANRGPFFATEVALKATSAPYFLIQDADDWSDPKRVERLLLALQQDGSDLAISAEPQFVETPQGVQIVEVRWGSISLRRDAGKFVVHPHITPSFKYRAPHHGLFRSASLRAIGGYYGGLRITYDTLVPNLILMTGRISHVPDRLYFRLLRRESLTHDSQTGAGSANARRELDVQRYLYRACYSYYRRFLDGSVTAPQLAASIRSICSSYVMPSDRVALSMETRRLSKILEERIDAR